MLKKHAFQESLFAEKQDENPIDIIIKVSYSDNMLLCCYVLITA